MSFRSTSFLTLSVNRVIHSRSVQCVEKNRSMQPVTN
nr:MAG TPA: hypothetical protein [Caudoviricetes sp.]